jgi:hypothetical protein
VKARFARLPSRGAFSPLGWLAAVGLAVAGVGLLVACSSGGSAQASGHTDRVLRNTPTAGSSGRPAASDMVSPPTDRSSLGPARRTRAGAPTSTATATDSHAPWEGHSSSQPPASSTSETGGIYQTVPPQHRKTLAPLPLRKPAIVGSGVTEHILSINTIHATAHGPGEISGPALRIVIEVANDSNKPINLDTALMTVSDADGTPGVEMTLNGTVPLRGNLAVGESARGTFVFTLPPTHRDPVTVNFSYSSVAAVTLFVGNVK